ncbi:MAG: magnesium transporter, partial [Candidatus Magnetoglobus multicellularis str. Araruama]
MYPDDIADLISEFYQDHKDKAEALLELLPEKDSEDISELMRYPEDTAGGLMTTDFIAIAENLSIRMAIKRIKALNPPNSEISFFIYIINEKQELIAMTTLINLLTHSLNEKVRDIRKENLIQVPPEMDQEEVARIISKYDLYAVPVTDEAGKLLGIVTADDVIDVYEEEATEDIYKLAGTAEIDEEKLLHGKLRIAVISRLPWLLLTIIGGFLSARLISYYTARTNYSIALPL